VRDVGPRTPVRDRRRRGSAAFHSKQNFNFQNELRKLRKLADSAERISQGGSRKREYGFAGNMELLEKSTQFTHSAESFDSLRGNLGLTVDLGLGRGSVGGASS
jgi:hypothetical protein